MQVVLKKLKSTLPLNGEDICVVRDQCWLVLLLYTGTSCLIRLRFLEESKSRLLVIGDESTFDKRQYAAGTVSLGEPLLDFVTQHIVEVPEQRETYARKAPYTITKKRVGDTDEWKFGKDITVKIANHKKPASMVRPHLCRAEKIRYQRTFPSKSLGLRGLSRPACGSALPLRVN